MEEVRQVLYGEKLDPRKSSLAQAEVTPLAKRR